MFKNSLITLIIGTLCIASCCLALIERPVDDYLLFLDPSAAYVEELKWLSDKLEESGLEKPEELATVVHNNLEQVRQARQGFVQSEHNEAKLEDVLDQFAHLSEPVETWDQDCRIVNSLQHYLDALDVLFGGVHEFDKLANEGLIPEKHSKMFIYMNYYGKVHLAQCLEALVDGYKTEAENGPWDEEESLDLMMTPKDNPDLVNDERYLLETANKFDYDKDDFYQFYTTKSSASTDVDLNEPSKVEGVFSLSCSELKVDLANVFVTYDISRLLIPEFTENLTHELDDRFHKLDEYIRLCNQSKNV